MVKYFILALAWGLVFWTCEDKKKEEHMLCCVPEVQGCTDPNAINYDGEATEDDGTCEY